MLKESITYTDYNGLERTEDYYFNITKNELVKMETGKEGSLSDKLTRIINAKDAHDIIAALDAIMLKAYGEKSSDGRRFIKSDEISEAFSQTPAYDALFEKMLSDSDYAINFVKGILPADLASQIDDKKLVDATTLTAADVK